MRILMFGWEFPPLISGGLGTACYGMTKHLAEEGEDVTFVMPKAPGEAKREGYHLLSAEDVKRTTDPYPLPDSVRVLVVNAGLLPYTHAEDFQTLIETHAQTAEASTEPQSIISLSGHYASNLFDEVQRFAEIGWRLGSGSDFDLIHAHDWMTYPAAIAAKQRSGRPLVVHVHATEFDRTGDNPNQAIMAIESKGLEEADRIIAVSYRTKNTLIQRYGIIPSKIEVVHNAVDHSRLVDPMSIHKGFREKLVIFVGRVTFQKGPEYFLRAAARVLKDNPQYRFVMCGAGDMLPRMIEEAAALRIQNRFHFTGFLRGEALDRLYSQADLFVMSSVSEPFGLTPFEAMRYRVPVIVSKQTGAAELLPQAVQVDFWDIHEMARMMLKICEDASYSRALREQQSSTLGRMTWKSVALKLQSIYRGLVLT